MSSAVKLPGRKALTIAALLLSGTSSMLHAQTGLYTLGSGTSTLTTLNLNSVSTDQSGVYVYGDASLSVGVLSVTKSGNASSILNSDEYGVNAGVLAGTTNAAGTVVITDPTSAISTTGAGASGLFATYPGSSITMDGGTVSTSGANSQGVDATHGGAVRLTGVDVTTTGPSSTAIATAYGAGVVTVNGGTISASDETAGSQSAGLYSTGTISVTGATVSSAADYGAVIDGANTINLTASSVSGLLGGVKLWNTGAAAGSAVLNVTGGSLRANAGDAFYVDGTDTGLAASAAITVQSGAALSASTGNLIRVTSSNSGAVSAGTITFLGETLTGALLADAVSTLTANLNNATELTGAATHAALNIDSSSTWNVTAPSTLTSLTNDGTVAFATDGLTLDVAGSLSQAASGKLVILLDGTTAGTNYDQVAVAGAASLAGTLEVDTVSGFAPTAGETFNVLTYGSASGAFTTLSSASGLTYTVSYGATEATITIMGAATPPASKAPKITTQPVSLSIAAGNDATFSVLAKGTVPLSYQWYYDGAPIGGATNSAYTVFEATAARTGSYDVVVTNALGSATSSTATLTVAAANPSGAPTVTIVVRGDGEIVQGGEKGKTLISRTGNIGTGLRVYYELKGTAINGTDYVGTDGKALPGSILIPAGSASVKLKLVATTRSKDATLQSVKIQLLSGPANSYVLGTGTKAKLSLLSGE